MIERLESMLDAGRDDAMLRFGLGSALFNEGRFEDAAIHLQRCIELDAGYSAAYKLLGKALYKLGRGEQAAPVFASGLKVAREQGDKQSEKEISVFLAKLEKQS